MRRFVLGLAILALASLASQLARADDQAIAQSILRQLKTKQDEGRLKDFDLDLTVEDGNVWLKGRVASSEQQNLAIDIARRTKGVKKVINALEKPAPSVASSPKAATSARPIAAKAAPTSAPPKSVAADDAPKSAPRAFAKNMTAQDYKKTDKEIADSIVATIKKHQQQGDLKGFDLDLYVDKGTVWLKGSVSSDEQQKLALDVARRTPGVRQVVNDLKVKSAPRKTESVKSSPQQEIRLVSNTQLRQPTASSPPPIANDEKIIASIKGQLAQFQSQGRLKGFGVNLHANEGVVWLKGQCSTKDQHLLILDIARRTPGVKKVVNEIQLVAPAAASNTASRPQPIQAALPAPRKAYWPTPIAATPGTPIANPYFQQTASPETRPATPASNANQDQMIVDQIAARFREYKREGLLNGFGIDLHSEGGVVTMQGRISNPAQRQLAIDLVRRTPGVLRVINRLEVASEASSLTASAPTPATPAPAESLVPSLSSQPAISRPAAQVSPRAVVQAPVPVRPTAESMPVGSPMGQSILSPQQAAQYAAYMAYQQALQSAPPTGAPVDQTPRPLTPVRAIGYAGMAAVAAPLAVGHAIGQIPSHLPGAPAGSIAPARYDHPQMPGYAWPSYASHPNYAAVTYPKQYSPSAWPYIGPFYPYPQVPLGWRKVSLEWDDGWWFLDFYDK